MVVLTLVTQKNGDTVYFDSPIPKVHSMRLLSCSLYNSWNTLKNEGTMSIVDSDKGLKVVRIRPGHYTLKELKNTMVDLLKKNSHEILADIYSPLGQLVIKNNVPKPLRIDRDLAELLGVGRDLRSEYTLIKRIVAPTAYYIHCDLIDKTNNLFNAKMSDLLAKIDVTGKPYEKVRYDTSLQVFRDCSTDSYVNSITLRVRDQDGELFDFNGLPLEFELEIN